MKGLDVYDYTGEGYNPTMHFNTWRVAFLNYTPDFTLPLKKIERHMQTDEVFVLLTGTATLVMGDDLTPVSMEPHKIYNVRAGAWHGIAVSPDAKVLIVENHNTTTENSEYRYY